MASMNSDDAEVFMLSGDLLYNIPLAGTFIEPFILGGAGVKKYTVDQPLEGLIFVTSSEFMWSLGGGARFPISNTAWLRVEVRDNMSTFDYCAAPLIVCTENIGVEEIGAPKLQHDIISKVGLSLKF